MHFLSIGYRISMSMKFDVREFLLLIKFRNIHDFHTRVMKRYFPVTVAYKLSKKPQEGIRRYKISKSFWKQSSSKTNYVDSTSSSFKTESRKINFCTVKKH